MNIVNTRYNKPMGGGQGARHFLRLLQPSEGVFTEVHHRIHRQYTQYFK
jgi:hypothetical protein